MSEAKQTGGPAFPFPAYTYPNGEINPGEGGMTLRQYAAIKLRVPDSGIGWLDDMIRKSQRDEFAAKAMQGCLAYSHVNPQWGNYHENSSVDGVAEMAYRYADAMLKARTS
jgi:hypothetical protein